VDVVRDQVMDVVKHHFRPEFLNRVDDIILFHRLMREHMGAIVDVQLQRLEKLLGERKISLTLTPAAKAFLAESGYDPAYGARPLKRSIQRLVQDPLAEEILSGRVKDGASVTVDLQAGVLVFNGVAAVAVKTNAQGGDATLH